MSTFKWLDYSSLERRKMLDVIDLFREKDTRDELGLGGVRDAFADLLFPGTTTLMTRARYLLIVPWIYQRLEEKKVSAAVIGARAREAELDLIEIIGCTGDVEGQIGKRARRALKRLPSNVYWHALGVWGIRIFRGDQAQYHRSLDRHYAVIGHHHGRTTERDDEHDDRIRPNWHRGLEPAPDGFPQECSLSLSAEEARYLSERIRLSESSAHSFLAEFLVRRISPTEVRFPWEHPLVGELHAELREQLLHAQNFSELMHGAMLLYNLMLGQECGNDGLASDFEARIGKWADTLARNERRFHAWDRVRFWELAEKSNSRISFGAREFINAWWDLARTHRPEVLAEAPPARQLVAMREARLKKGLRRLGNPRARERWGGESGAAQIDFRWRVARTILRDIFEGMDAPYA